MRKNPLVCLLVTIVTAGTLAGCFTVGESSEESALANNFSGNPHIEGSYSPNGLGAYWNGSSFQKFQSDLTNLGYLFRNEDEKFGFKCDRVVFHKESDGTLTIRFQVNGAVDHSLHFVPGRNYSESADRLSLKIKRVPGGGSITEEAELLLALDKSGKLRVIERENITTVTGVGIPIVPMRGKDVSSYTFDPLPLP